MSDDDHGGAFEHVPDDFWRTNTHPSSDTSPEDDSFFTLEKGLRLQRELLERFKGSARFKRRVRELLRLYPQKSSVQFRDGIAEACLEIQKEVLPRYGFPGTPEGVNLMIFCYGPYVQNAEFIYNRAEFNRLLELDTLDVAGVNPLPELQVGATVRVHSLQIEPYLNGALGVCTAYDRGRWKVQLWNGEETTLWAENLVAVDVDGLDELRGPAACRDDAAPPETSQEEWRQGGLASACPAGCAAPEGSTKGKPPRRLRERLALTVERVERPHIRRSGVAEAVRREAELRRARLERHGVTTQARGDFGDVADALVGLPSADID